MYCNIFEVPRTVKAPGGVSLFYLLPTVCKLCKSIIKVTTLLQRCLLVVLIRYHDQYVYHWCYDNVKVSEWVIKKISNINTFLITHQHDGVS